MFAVVSLFQIPDGLRDLAQRVRRVDDRCDLPGFDELLEDDQLLLVATASLRGCADRSWSAVRSAFPSVAHPAFSNQPPHDDHHLRERHPEIDHPPYPLRTPHQFLMRVMPRVRPLRHPTLP